MKLDTHKQLEAKMSKTIEALKYEYTTIRTGRANAQMLDKIRVDYYGTPTPINQMAAISVPEPRTLMISAWDKSSMAEIEKAIRNSDLGLNPSNDGEVIRLSVPVLTEERRKELAKKAHKSAEEFKVRLRNERRDANDELKKLEKNGELTEDELKKAQDEVQKITDKFIKEVDAVAVAKEKDIMEV
ncbi:ribosome recycling factor [Romboutsia lituseburensis]|uniref:ribosome recycling factor n=1 Tax=Romboutsia lituseburensis TaxID=1537 RepID=UPI0022EA7D6C|nr:ribosome recycling factor [Romboutsia lituseburensis]